MQGTGGVRKLRWARGGRGKSGGVRLIYYYHSEAMPLYLLTVFAKNEQGESEQAERNDSGESWWRTQDDGATKMSKALRASSGASSRRSGTARASGLRG
jgi:hypothetical protein